nr:YmfL family putative regulatory protein [Pantoea cypripedii]
MDHKHWQVEKQPAWLVAAIKKTISSLPGGYAEAAEWLGVTEDALFNRLRSNGDQIFPMGWAMVLQQASGTKHIADAVSRQSNSVNVPLVDLEEVDNEDINQKLIETFEQLSRYSERFREAVKDGVMDKQEFEELKEEAYLASVKLQEHLNLGKMIHGEPEELNAPGCSPERSCGDKSWYGDKTA